MKVCRAKLLIKLWASVSAYYRQYSRCGVRNCNNFKYETEIILNTSSFDTDIILPIDLIQQENLQLNILPVEKFVKIRAFKMSKTEAQYLSLTRTN